jgi:hypothetical protein
MVSHSSFTPYGQVYVDFSNALLLFNSKNAGYMWKWKDYKTENYKPLKRLLLFAPET